MKKYEFTGETQKVEVPFRTVTLYRIRATMAFGRIEAGEPGGWIEKEENLSHNGAAWVYDNAKVCGNALVYGNAQIYSNALVCGNAQNHGNAEVCGNALVCDNAEVYGNALVCGSALVHGNAKVSGNAEVYGNARVCDAEVYNNVWVYGNALVCDNAEVYGSAKVCGNAEVCSDALVLSASHMLVIGPIGSRGGFTTFYRDKDNEITVKCGCFLGKIDKFLEEVTQTHGDTKHALVYRAAAEAAKLQIKEGSL